MVFWMFRVLEGRASDELRPCLDLPMNVDIDALAADIWASNYQSNHDGGYVPPNSLFLTYPSYGAVND